MAYILIVDDDPDQSQLRQAILQQAGHYVDVALTAQAAGEAVSRKRPDVVLMDLCLPRREDGEALLTGLKTDHAGLKVIVLTGCSGEARDADIYLQKPLRSAALLRAIARLVMCLLLALGLSAAEPERFFEVASGEIVADITISSPEPEWVSVKVENRPEHRFLTWAAPQPYRYPVFLGPLPKGRYSLTLSRSAERVEFRAAHDHELHAPVLYARQNTIGKMTDVPLLAYATRGSDPGGPYLEFNIIFSNEDGGTSTRALMARWGRTTDIEYVYHVWLDAGGSPKRAIVQGKDHKDIEYAGRYEGRHPVLIPVTDNNMVHFEGESSVRYQLAPALIDLSRHSREQVMDDHPLTYRFSSLELIREGKVRPYGIIDGEKISDPRNYVVIEANVATQQAVIQALVRVAGRREWHGGSLGIPGHWIERSGWLRTAVEIPPGTTPEEIAFQCILPKPLPARCVVESVTKVFQLRSDYTPGPSLFSTAQPVELKPGSVTALPLQ